MSSNYVRLLAATAFAAAMTVAAPAAQGALAQLGLNEGQAKLDLLSAVNYGSVSIGGAAKLFKAASPAVQKTIIDGVVAWAKAHTSSAEFKRAYAESRNNTKPDPPATQAESDAQARNDLAEQQKAIEEMKKVAASLPPDQRKAMEDGIKEAIAAMKAMQNDPEMQKMMKQMAVEGRKADEESYKDALAKWNEDHPENPNVLIARRLRAFLDTSASVDFNAKVEKRDGKLKFVESKYEEKPAEWKMCYRAGRDAVDAARSVASAWLKEIAK